MKAYMMFLMASSLLNAFSTSTYITAQSGCKSRRAWMPKRMASQ
jgi:hypothetical protein